MEENQEKRTEIGQLGEFGLIKVLTAPFKSNNESTIKAVGDDAAVPMRGHTAHEDRVAAPAKPESVGWRLRRWPSDMSSAARRYSADR